MAQTLIASSAKIASYKGAAFDIGFYYCPYVPLGISTIAIPKSALSMDLRDNQGGWFDGVAVLHVNNRHEPPKELLQDIAVWCVQHWGAPGLGEPALWKIDRDIIFVHDANLLIELKMQWHGYEL
jgi:hypothetical protein